MFKFITGRNQSHANAETSSEKPVCSDTRQASSTDFLAFAQPCCYRGFPARPSCIAFDPCLRLLALGTRNGEIRIYGRPGVQFFARSSNAIRSLDFCPGRKGRLVSICESGAVEIWQFHSTATTSQINCVLSTSEHVSSQLKMYTAHAILENGAKLAVGVESGDIVFLDLQSLCLSDTMVRKADVHLTIPDRYRAKSGVVETICESVPPFQYRLLIGYTKGLIVLWNLDADCLEQMYIYNQQIECLCWYKSFGTNGGRFASSHSDGSYMLWQTESDNNPQLENRMPYGPFPCRAINRIIVREQLSGDGDILVIFSGGLPKSSLPNKSCVSVSTYNEQKRSQDELVAFDLSSRLVDMLVVDGGVSCSPDHWDGPSGQVLFILTEQELLAIDVQSHCPLRLPYLNSIHFSPVSVLGTAQVSAALVDHLDGVTDLLPGNDLSYSDRRWPEMGGDEPGVEERGEGRQRKTALVTGHMDGSLCFWGLDTTAFPMLFRWASDQHFRSSRCDEPLGSGDSQDEEDNWPPFARVSAFDEKVGSSDLKIESFCVANRGFSISISNALGYVVIFELDDIRSVNSCGDQEVCSVEEVGVDFSERKCHPWNGGARVPMSPWSLKQPLSCHCGFKPVAVLRMLPVGLRVTALEVLPDAGIAVVGTNAGFVIYDYVQMRRMVQRVTSSAGQAAALTNTSLAVVAEQPFVRGKSLKKSLRESFRRLRRNKLHGSSFHQTPSTYKQLTACRINETNQMDTILPVERQVEWRDLTAKQQSELNIVTCLYYNRCHRRHLVTSARNSGQQCDTDDVTLMIGTHNGTVHLYSIQLPLAPSARSSAPLVCEHFKEIVLRHRAPVVAMAVIDERGSELSKSLPSRASSALEGRASDPAQLPPLQHGSSSLGNPANEGQMRSQWKWQQRQAAASCHKLVICTEEQVKLFDLGQLRQFAKYKLTAFDGSIIRKAFFCHDQTPHVCCLTSNGSLTILSLPHLRRLACIRCTRPQDILGLTNFTLIRHRHRALIFTSPGEMCELTTLPSDTGFPNWAMRFVDSTLADSVGEQLSLNSSRDSQSITTSRKSGTFQGDQTIETKE